jgi:hypothetical protein
MIDAPRPRGYRRTPRDHRMGRRIEGVAVNSDIGVVSQQGCPARITVLEALASELVPTGPNMSNRSTPTAADADDQ